MARDPNSEDQSRPKSQRTAHARSRARAAHRAAQAARKGRLGRGLVPTVLLASLVLFLAGLMLTGRAVPLPSALRVEIANAVSSRIPGSEVRIGAVAVTLGRDGAPRVRMRNITFGDAAGGGVAALNAVSARLSPGALLQGRLAAERVVLDGAQVTLRRAADGTFALRSGGEAAGREQTLSTMLSALARVLDEGPLASIQEVLAEHVVISLEDARTGRIWQATNASMQLRRADNGLSLSVSSDVFNGTDDLAAVQVSFSFDDTTQAIGLGMRLTDVPAADIAVQSAALSWLGVLDAPISGAVRASFDAQAGLDQLSGTLDISTGALSPDAGTEPIGFEAARAYFAYDPDVQRIDFTEVAVQSELLRATATGHTYLSEVTDGWPAAFVGQFVLSEVAVDRADVFEAPVTLRDVRADMRLRLDPFTVEVAQMALDNDGVAVRGSGEVAARADGWHIALDADTAEIDSETVLSFWPLVEAPVTRGWLSDNLKAGRLTDVTVALRKRPGSKPDLGLTFDFAEGDVQFLRSMPGLTAASGRGVIHNNSFDLILNSGGVAAGTGDRVNVAGSTFRVPDIEEKPATGEIVIRAQGAIPALLSVTNNPPLRLMERAGRGIDLAEGKGDVTARVTLPLKDGILADEVDFAVAGQFRDLRSDVIVPGRVFTSRQMALLASPEEVRLTGPADLDGARLTADWRQPLGADGRAAGSRVTGRLALGPDVIEAFDLPLLPGLLRGSAQAEYTLEIKPDTSPVLSLTSDLQGLGMRIDALGWQKTPDDPGGLELLATLGDVPDVTSLAISAPGLALDGRLSLTADGGLQSADFDQVRVGRWLDARARLIPRAAGQSPSISIEGGTLDFRAFPRDQLAGGDGGARAPISVSLDTFVLSDAISFAPLDGQIDAGQAGLSGTFEARLNGQTPVRGTLAPANGGTAIRLQADDAGGVVRSAGLTANASGGTLDVVLTPDPTAAPGTLRGEFLIEDIRIQNAPVMAAILDTISLVGLIDQLSGQGIRFATIDGRFRLTPDAFVLDEAAAIGGSIGISAAGIYDLNAKVIDLQGVVSPFYFLNAVGSLVSRRGEGLFGFNYRVSGPANAPTVSVNPLSILTPGLFREIFRRPPPTN